MVWEGEGTADNGCGRHVGVVVGGVLAPMAMVAIPAGVTGGRCAA